MVLVVVRMDFFSNSIDRITRRLAEQKDFVSFVHDENPRNLHASVCQELGSTIRGHLIQTGGIATSKLKTPFRLMLWLPKLFPFPSKKRMPSAANSPVLVLPVL